ncbi:MAG: NADH-quinone oxidoreductase subunit L [Rhodospirillales bacterium]|nr:NADH-quinone oxidoreductase subunit L [Rhodospirillales bacterium]
MEFLAIATVFLPLIGAVAAGLLGRQLGDKVAPIVTCVLLIASAFSAWLVFLEVVSAGTVLHPKLFTWIDVGSFEVDWAIYVDQVTAVMLIVVTTVSAIVHIYSIGYMEHDPHRPRFFAYLSLFTFAMLTLVTADNFLQMFFGWEGVGVCSYLLIGFWYRRSSANAAAIKAFLVNRVGDFGFALGIMGVFVLFDTVVFQSVFDAVPDKVGEEIHFLSWNVDAITVLCLLLFIGAMGKSAQVPLHTWLPDAMEGPTPVSALIHAATMVTAGVFMVVRLSPMFAYSPDALMVVTFVGATTAIFAATVGIAQNDIKRVIAYSTCSQLGYMFFACGVGAYPVALFHLFTHAFFKALLFLCSGSVIHAMHDEQDMRRMGGLWRKLPITYAFMWIGSLALAGIPLFAGYYSKDLIIESAYVTDTFTGQYAFWLGCGAAFLTALYSWRLIIMTFHGKPRMTKETFDHAHEAPKIMWVPLTVLAVGAVIGGYGLFGGKMVYHGGGEFFGPSIMMYADEHAFAAHSEADESHSAAEDNHGDAHGETDVTHADGHHDELDMRNAINKAHEETPFWVKAMIFLIVLSGIATAYVCYMFLTHIPGLLASQFRPVYKFLLNKWYFDELFDWMLVRPAKRLGYDLWKTGDGEVIDGLGPDGVAAATLDIARRAQVLQSGYVYHYAFAMLIGLVVVASWLLFKVWG